MSTYVYEIKVTPGRFCSFAFAARVKLKTTMSGHGKRLIYFCGSIRGGRDDAALYRRIIDQLKQYGDVLTEHIADPNVLDIEQGLP